MIEFNEYWTSFAPDAEYANRRNATERLWDSLPEEKQTSIMAWLDSHRPPEKRNPYFFIVDFHEEKPKQETLSYNEYYKRYGTTEEQDGWRRVFLPEEHKTIYVK